MNHYDNIQASLLRFCADFRDAMVPLGYDIEALNLDGFTDEDQWPNKDFIGVGNVNIDITEFYEISLAFAISTKGDTNLHRMGKLTKLLLDRVLPQSVLPVFDSQTGILLGSLFVLRGVRVGAPEPTKINPIRPVMVRLISDLTSS